MDKIILITGATSGIGKAAAIELAKMGAKLILVARNSNKLKNTVEEIKNISGNNNIDSFICDLTSQKAIADVALEIKKKYQKIDVLYNNAGLIFDKRKLTIDGYEHTFALNHLGYFLLTGHLLDLVKAAAPSRIVNVSSMAGNMGHINFDDIMGEKKYASFAAYSQSKLANQLFTFELARKLDGSGVTVNCLHPGIVNTNFGKELSGFGKFVMKLGLPFFINAEKGAETSVYLITSPEVEGITGKYFSKKKPAKTTPESLNTDIAKKLWKLSEELTNFSY